MTTAAAEQSSTAAAWWSRAGALRAWRIGLILLRRANDDSTLMQAAALAFTTLFSMLPIFALLVMVISIFGGNGKQRGSLTGEVEHWTLNELGLNQLSVPESGPTSSARAEHKSDNLVQIITDRVQDIQQSMEAPATGVIIFGVLLWGTISLMLAIERAFTRIYRARRKRKMMERVMLYTTVIAVGPVLVAGSIYAMNKLSQLSAGMFHPAWSVAQFAASMVLSAIGLTVMYRIVPPVRVPWWNAALGGAVAALLWEAGKLLFGVYIKHAVGYGRFYGNLALVPLFMFWIYMTWCFVLIGLEAAYVSQHLDALLRRLHQKQAGESGLTDIRWVLPLALLLNRAFQGGRVLTANQAADELNLTEEAAEALLVSLKQADLAHYVERGNGFTLARPAERIKVDDLLTAARHASRSPSVESLNRRAIEALRQVEQDWASGLTLAELAQ